MYPLPTVNRQQCKRTALRSRLVNERPLATKLAAGRDARFQQSGQRTRDVPATNVMARCSTFCARRRYPLTDSGGHSQPQGGPGRRPRFGARPAWLQLQYLVCAGHACMVIIGPGAADPGGRTTVLRLGCSRPAGSASCRRPWSLWVSWAAAQLRVREQPAGLASTRRRLQPRLLRPRKDARAPALDTYADAYRADDGAKDDCPDHDEELGLGEQRLGRVACDLGDPGW